jgi:hypothetical protein
VALLAIGCALPACGAPPAPVHESTAVRSTPAATGAGIGTARRLPPLGKLARTGAPINGLRCTGGGPGWAIHVELFARGHVVIVPAGIGITPPRRRHGAYVIGGRCRYPLWTSEPTGLVHVARPGLRLGDLFAIWGQPLTLRRLARWTAGVTAHVDGVRWRGDPAAIPLRHHAEIVVQAGAPVQRPHAGYLFPDGL